jgi:DNA-binding NarL/FixJ family response regulator
MIRSDKHISANAKPGSNIRAIRTVVVDDSPLMLDLLMSILQRDGRITLVGTANDGWQVLPEVLRLAPELVLMDLHLPHLDGAEATRYLKLLANAPKIFIVSADDSPAARQLSMNSGADAFVTKTAEIETQLRSALDQSFGFKHSPTTDYDS